MLENISPSDLLGFTSIGCWLGAQFPQVVENIRRQSCEGLALPFLANWLLGDISNLVGCILTHQLPFQTWLATYFVCVDCMLVAQYFYYYKTPKHLPSIHHIRSATAPVSARRLSVDRGASRYRTLSAVASNMAAAAALAAQQEEQADTQRTPRFAHKPGRRRAYEGSEGRTPRPTGEDEDEDLPTTMVDSFHSEGGRTTTSKQVSWSIERHGGRAASVGRALGPTTPTMNLLPDESLTSLMSPGSLQRDPSHIAESTESLSALRGSRASRRGSNMVFLAVWALFGIGTLAGRQNMPSTSLMNVGRVLSINGHHLDVPISTPPIEAQVHSRDAGLQDFDDLEIGLTPLDVHARGEDVPNHEPHPDDPSPEQVLGRLFAWLCTTLYLTSRLPQIWKNYVRKSVEGLSMYLFVFAFLGNVFYVASILASPRRFLPPPESAKYLKESIPYLLGSGGTLIFDITIVGQSFCYRSRHRRHATMAYSRVPDEEESGLLSGDALSAHPPGDSAILNRGRTSRTRAVG
ncbi:unnamed protein product [Cyclocybe aegerita]|uniref:Uncharacterized protein n=1 Tax=Cyclocybe aegerita TaxID=1973307 RepID=A0A8S0X2E9_CYCAE|nr:unnamed protein product [Cyclocybe aegerita]